MRPERRELCLLVRKRELYVTSQYGLGKEARAYGRLSRNGKAVGLGRHHYIVLKISQFRQQPYGFFDTGKGNQFEEGKLDLKDFTKLQQRTGNRN